MTVACAVTYREHPDRGTGRERLPRTTEDFATRADLCPTGGRRLEPRGRSEQAETERGSAEPPLSPHLFPLLSLFSAPLMTQLEVDLSAAKRFVALLGERSTFQVFAEGDTKSYQAGWSPHGTLLEHADSLIEANNLGCGVSVVVNETNGTGRKYGDIVRARAVFLDLDTEAEDGGRLPLPNFGKERWPSVVVKTRRGWHCYWFLRSDEGYDLDQWDLVMAAMARKWDGDPKMNRATCLRIPGFWHHKKSPPTLMELGEHCEPREWSLGELVQAFALRLEVPQQRPKSGGLKERPRWAREAIARMPQHERARQYEEWVAEQPSAVEGSGGHAQLLKVIKMAYNFGVEWDNALGIVEAYNDRCQPPWRPKALDIQFHSATRGRFDPTNWESRLWAPEPEVERRTGARPPDDIPMPEGRSDGVRRVVISQPEPPPFPDEPPGGYEDGAWQSSGEPGTWSDAPAHDRSYQGGTGGSGGGGSGGPREPWEGAPPPNRMRILSKHSPLDSARAFVREMHVQSHCRTLGMFRRSWYAWCGTHYENFSKERVNNQLYSYAAPARTYGPTGKDGQPKLVAFNPTASKVNDIRHALESLVFVDDTMRPPCWLGESGVEERPEPKEIVAASNGLLHLPTMRFLGPRPDYFGFTSLGVAHDPNAAAPSRWLAFLDELWPEDRASKQLLQEWFGLMLVPDTSFQKALLIVGPKRCGKGTIARVMNAMHGAQNSVAWPSMTDLTSRFGMQGLLDKTVAIMPDLRVSGRIDTQQAIERFLQITGEDWVLVDRKNLPMIQAQIPVRFMMLSNLAPRLPDAGGAFASRVLALEIERSFFGNEDRFLTERLIQELPGILQWAIEGWQRLRARGHFEQPPTGAALLQELSHLSNPMQAFVQDRCELSADAETSTDELFVQWRKWCEEEGRQGVGEKSTFVRNMRAAHPELRSTRPTNAKGTRMRALKGIRIVYKDDPKPEQGSLLDDVPPPEEAPPDTDW